MSQFNERVCPECQEEAGTPTGVGRREFIRRMSSLVGAAGVSATIVERPAQAAPAASAESKTGESLVQELYATLTDEQKQAMVLPWNHGEAQGQLTRLKTFNGPPLGKRLGEQFTKPQQDLILQTLKSILSGEEAFERLTRGGRWDGAGSFEGNGIAIFGDPSGKAPFSWMFAGHHLTLRCDGNSQPNTAFGGPMYYGHSANGHSSTNVYNYQTREVMGIFDMLNDKHREKAVVVGIPGDGQNGLRNRAPEERPGVAYADLDASQQAQVAGVMRTLLAPFRQEDGDEVMQLIKAGGGMEKIQLAFFKDRADKTNDRWDYWRLEGPGFVWNYRVLPHVHCFVNIVGQA